MNSSEFTPIDIILTQDLIEYTMLYFKYEYYKNIDSKRSKIMLKNISGRFMDDYNADYSTTINHILEICNVSPTDTVYDFILKANRKPEEQYEFMLINGCINYNLFNIHYTGKQKFTGHVYKLNLMTIRNTIGAGYIWIRFKTRDDLDTFITHCNLYDLCKTKNISIGDKHENDDELQCCIDCKYDDYDIGIRI